MKNEDLKIARHRAQAIREEASRGLKGLLSDRKRRMFERLESLSLQLVGDIEDDLEARGEEAA